MGGTINVITQDETTAGRNRTGFHGELSLIGQTADMSGGSSARALWSSRRLSWLGGGAVYRYNDLRAGDGEDSRNAFRRYFGLSGDQVQSVYGERLQDTGFLRYSADSRVGVNIADDQKLTFYFQHSDMQNVRSYRDQWGGVGRLQALFYPQSLNLGYVRYEKLRLGFLDSLTGTFSVNSQNDGFVQQNPLLTDVVQSDDSSVHALGYQAQATTHVGSRDALVFGGEVYRETIGSYRFVFDPVRRTTTQQRALYPNGSDYINAGYFAQNTLELVPGRLRIVAGLRFTDISYSTSADANRTAAGASLGVPDSSQRFHDLTFNTSLSWQIAPALSFFTLVGRGFRAPNVNDLGTVELARSAMTCR